MKFRISYLGVRKQIDVIVTVDMEDATLLRNHVWRADRLKTGWWKIRRCRNGIKESLGNVILGLKPGEKIHHINGDSLDFRRSNITKKASLGAPTRPELQVGGPSSG